jgi:hypothetical protein
MFQQFLKQSLYYSALIGLFIVFNASGCSREKSAEIDKTKISINDRDKTIEVKNEYEEVKVEGDDNQGKIKIKTKNGESNILYGNNKLADGFPKDIPIYQPSTVQMSQIMESGKTIMASLTADDDAEKVLQFYKKALPEAGWKVSGEMNMGGTALIQGEKGEKELNVSVNKEQGKTVISLVEGNK